MKTWMFLIWHLTKKTSFLLSFALSGEKKKKRGILWKCLLSFRLKSLFTKNWQIDTWCGTLSWQQLQNLHWLCSAASKWYVLSIMKSYAKHHFRACLQLVFVQTMRQKHYRNSFLSVHNHFWSTTRLPIRITDWPGPWPFYVYGPFFFFFTSLYLCVLWYVMCVWRFEISLVVYKLNVFILVNQSKNSVVWKSSIKAT